MLNEDATGASGARETLSVDLNCDMGEGMDTDAAIFPFISSANIACGYHAGDADTMRKTVELALRHHVAIGAHPSYPDPQHFGRIDLLDTKLSPEEIPGMIVDQLILLQAVCDEFGVRLHHVKPHGALYNRAAKDAMVSALICRAIREFDPSLILYGLSGSQLKKEAHRHELTFISEVFADRTYQEDGSLTPRTQPDALIEDPKEAIAQVVKMVREGKVFVPSVRKEIPLVAETICLHGDGSHAAEFARLIHTVLLEKEITVQAPEGPFII
ncbi:MAG TPA: 5-oxoprolinase subunit PxpA [Puia sp.]|nr:5-oxoprolinase subunit PxpA [Puia sp.]